VAIIVGLLVIGGISSYRAYVQVRSPEIDTGRDLTVGSNVGVSAVIRVFAAWPLPLRKASGFPLGFTSKQ